MARTQKEKVTPLKLTGYTGTFTSKNVVQVLKLPSSPLPFHASQPHLPCRVSEVPLACWADEPGGKRMAKPWTKEDRTQEQKREACEIAGGVFTAPSLKKNRPGKMELEFLSPKQAAEMGTEPGPNLRLCFKDAEPGKLVPVANPTIAKEVQKAFEECIGGKRGAMKDCALRIAGRTAPLGSAPKRSRSSSGSLMSRLSSSRW